MMDLDNPPIDRFPRKTSELRDALRRAWRRVNVIDGGASSPGESLSHLLPWRFPKAKRLPKKLQLWLMIYDESVTWVCALHICCELSLVRSRSKSSGDRDLVDAIFRLSARVASDLFAVRNLVCFGLEPAARTVLRSAMEHLDTISLLLLEPLRAREFLATSEPEIGNTFWHKNLSKDKLRKVIRAYFKEIDADLAREFLSQREQRSKLYGIAVHPSVYSCDMSLFSPEALEHHDASHVGIGYPTVLSCNTLHDAAWSILEVGVVLKTHLLNRPAALQKLFSKDPDGYFLGVVREGPSVFLSTLITVNHPSLRSVYHDLIEPT